MRARTGESAARIGDQHPTLVAAGRRRRIRRGVQQRGVPEVVAGGLVREFSGFVVEEGDGFGP